MLGSIIPRRRYNNSSIISLTASINGAILCIVNRIMLSYRIVYRVKESIVSMSGYPYEDGYKSIRRVQVGSTVSIIIWTNDDEHEDIAEVKIVNIENEGENNESRTYEILKGNNKGNKVTMVKNLHKGTGEYSISGILRCTWFRKGIKNSGPSQFV